ncbi:unnamed protein product [Rotaria magnacalcarata]|uniref:Calcineurin-like phosphoesterase domain-containing protein n=2 Tax=Rotaria magnacalcarata TaxID=392030 RepID=A0A819DLZ0_9BILA|nr:unnamed protein product [Rotaria magnacalcarata]CAF1674857.1 unnamed protein product [Rotaria magnacalcarata]CAF1917315.1 unnamed protein product [Rotaria magnacalcarata]CAF2128369.1 unnamed protein product [Rotaria magnacalcarata]CAF2197143.1 unnamed protein product [Rotaria magnacalcarata]
MLVRRRQLSTNKESKTDMNRLRTSSRYLPNSLCFRTRFKRWIWTQYGFLMITAIFVIFINEVLFYEWSRVHWPDIEELVKKPTVEKLLLVADPQLIGEKDEGFFGLITRKDSDRYLAKTFSQANQYVQPDWILFLGDIFDEGLSATDDEFKRYFERFDSIFQYENREQKCIVIPGDNDVGGEYYGDKHPMLRQRFRNYFGRTIALYRQNEIEYLKLDIDMFESYVDGKRVSIMEQTQNRPLTSIFRIVLNHWPLLTRSARFVKPFINELEPNLILKGDSHHFHIFAYDRINMTNRVMAREYLSQSILSIDLNEKRFIYEITTPTCSYRMGVARIGYVVLLLDSATKTAHLAILPTPRRYISLYIYAVYGICFLINLILMLLFPRRSLFKWLTTNR